jgi:hypothetical protein
MPARPKIRVSGPGWSEYPEDLDFERARLLPFCRDILIAVEGRVVNSFEELEGLADQAPFSGLEFLNITLLPIMVGG